MKYIYHELNSGLQNIYVEKSIMETLTTCLSYFSLDILNPQLRYLI